MSSTRRDFIRAGIGAGVGMAGALAALQQTAAAQQAGASAAGKRPRSVLLLLTDDMSNHMSCMGVRGLQTPTFDRLAQRGMAFTNAFSTCASCSPARSGILTGMAPHSNGHWRNTVTPNLGDPDVEFTRQSSKLDQVGVHEDIPTLIELLTAAGFATGITQKWHLSPHWKFPFTHRMDTHVSPQHARDKARQFFASLGREQPFFLMANIGNTHRPYPNHIVPIDLPPVDPDAVEVPADMPDTPIIRDDLAQYLTTVQVADRVATAYLDELESSGRAEETLIIFSADQGWPYTRAKASAYDMGVRVPFIIYYPGMKPGGMNRSLVSHIDILPTVMDWLGLATPLTAQGRTLMPVLEQQRKDLGRDIVFAEHNAHGPAPQSLYPSRSAFDGRFHYLCNLMPERDYTPPADLTDNEPWKNFAYDEMVRVKDDWPMQWDLLQRLRKRPAEEFYDLQSDPLEMENLADSPYFREELAKLRSATDQWMQETDDVGDPRQMIRRTAAP